MPTTNGKRLIACVMALLAAGPVPLITARWPQHRAQRGSRSRACAAAGR
jgi:hypothetical protein